MAIPTVNLTSLTPNASESGALGAFRVSRNGNTGSDLTVTLTINRKSTASSIETGLLFN